ncbi:hypothetical protein Tcan_00078 [Toxocara canis]|uniref:Uncharacterized protein n=1 Tax=Toxocara canis TaxID=6265 RepID=A0A0B2VVE2_TOXCA|nr:hypothetical protein Tcan_00078 [Toxocara canis]
MKPMRSIVSVYIHNGRYTRRIYIQDEQRKMKSVAGEAARTSVIICKEWFNNDVVLHDARCRGIQAVGVMIRDCNLSICILVAYVVMEKNVYNRLFVEAFSVVFHLFLKCNLLCVLCRATCSGAPEYDDINTTVQPHNAGYNRRANRF